MEKEFFLQGLNLFINRLMHDFYYGYPRLELLDPTLIDFARKEKGNEWPRRNEKPSNKHIPHTSTSTSFKKDSPHVPCAFYIQIPDRPINKQYLQTPLKNLSVRSKSKSSAHYPSSHH